MQISTEYLHHWMQAIRQSPDPMRTMDAFWSGQLQSKEWLINTLKRHHKHHKSWPSIEIYGGWVGVLASMIFQSGIYVSKITSIDIDPTCESIANIMNQLDSQYGKFRAVTADMTEYTPTADVVINTSCEHITQDQYKHWLSRVPSSSLIVLQSNNYAIPEHIRTAETLEEFKEQSGINVLWSGSLKPKHVDYNRWMIIGKK